MLMNYTKGLAEQFKILILMSTLTSLIPYLFSTVSYILIRLENKYLHSGKSWVQAIILSSLAFLFSLWAIAGSGQETVYWGFILLMAGVPFYVITRWNNKS
jgi:APA family basic amino acid/polyamine antiporter